LKGGVKAPVTEQVGRGGEEVDVARAYALIEFKRTDIHMRAGKTRAPALVKGRET
jgi:hypothetical protein